MVKKSMKVKYESENKTNLREKQGGKKWEKNI